MKYIRIIKATMGCLSSLAYMTRQFISLYRMIDINHETVEIDNTIDKSAKAASEWLTNSGLPAMDAMMDPPATGETIGELKPIDDDTISKLLEELKIKSDQ